MIYTRKGSHNVFLKEKKSIPYTTRNIVNRFRSITTMRKNHTQVQVPAGTEKTARATKKKPAAKGFFRNAA